MMKRNNFYALLASVMLAATAGLMMACTIHEDNPATPSGPSESVIKEKIVGKWKAITQDGKERVTNRRTVMTFFANGSMTYSRAFPSDYMEQYNWEYKVPYTYTVSGNIITREGLEADGQMRMTFYEVSAISSSEVEMNLTGYVLGGQNYSRNMVNLYKRVSADYSEDIIGLWEVTGMTGEETYNDDNARLAFLADGTYRYYRKDDAGEWQLVSTRDVEDYIVDGDWVATRWQETGGEMNYEWWDIDEIKDGQMKWSALREREDGTRFTTTFTWRRIGAPAGVEAVDLGLSVKWANMNVGAESVTDYGKYYAWGTTTDNYSENKEYNWDNTPYYSSDLTKYTDSDDKNVLEAADDAAAANWAGSWRMPTEAEFTELLNNTTRTWQTNYNGVSGCNGYLFTSTVSGYTDKSIFLPAAGKRDGSSLYLNSSDGFYWLSTLYSGNASLGRNFVFFSGVSGDPFMSGYDRYLGFTVRAVQ